MKHLKKFEKNTVNKPKVGDYVICGGGFSSNNSFIDHIKSNIGLVTSILENNYYSSFENSYNIEYKYGNFYFEIENNKKETVTYTTLMRDIKHWSKNKEELEAILASNKYNL